MVSEDRALVHEPWGHLTLELGTGRGTHRVAQKRLPQGQRETSCKGTPSLESQASKES